MADDAPGRASLESLDALLLVLATGDEVEAGRLLDAAPWLARAANDQGVTALMAAAQHNQGVIARRLIALGADMAAIDRVHGSTPLGWAAFYGSVETVAVLLEAGADASYVNSYGLTPEGIADGGLRGEHTAEAPQATPGQFQAILALLRSGT